MPPPADRDQANDPPPLPPRAAEEVQQLSHDIRSAMSDVIGGLRLVEIDHLDLRTLTQFERVRAAADTLAGLVEDALLTATGETLVKRDEPRVLLEDCLQTLTRRWAGRAAAQGGRFRLQLANPLPNAVNIAQLPLERIIGNLVSNGLLHGGGSEVVLVAQTDAHLNLVLRVEDGGSGFPAEVLAATAALGDARSMGPGQGSGLGLRIALALSSEIGAELLLFNDAKTGGASARLTIPAAHLDWHKDATTALALPDLSGLRVLVAEDNLTNQTILRQMLEQMGAIATIAADGVAALAALEAAPFDIALIDIEMPRLDGLQVMRDLRSRDSPLARMPILAITAYVLRDNREAIYAAGADGIVGKPVASVAEFGRTIQRHVGHPVDLPSPDAVAAGRSNLGLAQKIDTARLEALFKAAGPKGKRELVARLIEDLCAVRDLLDRGVETRSITEIRGQTHILIAISGAVGADRLCQLAEVLNIAAKRRRFDQLAAIYAPVRADLVDLLTLVQAQPVAIDDV